jgi:two-component system, OmpR family, KDP operon response regulator KdpE
MSTQGQGVLIVEDEAHMRRFLKTTLRLNGYDPLEAVNGQQALKIAGSQQVSVVLLDLGLPDIDGIEVVTQLREKSDVPIIVISARDQEGVKIEALDRGANDYVTKPFGAGELLARIRAMLRMVPRLPAPALVATGELEVDLLHRLVRLSGSILRVTPTEYSLLAVLARKIGRVVSHKELLREVWGPDSTEQVEYLRVFMRQLRYKIEKEPSQPRYLVTVSGVGYRLTTED